MMPNQITTVSTRPLQAEHNKNVYRQMDGEQHAIIHPSFSKPAFKSQLDIMLVIKK